MGLKERINTYKSEVVLAGGRLSAINYLRKNFIDVSDLIAEMKNQNVGSSYEVISNLLFEEGIKSKNGSALSVAYIKDALIKIRKENGLKIRKKKTKLKIKEVEVVKNVEIIKEVFNSAESDGKIEKLANQLNIEKSNSLKFENLYKNEVEKSKKLEISIGGLSDLQERELQANSKVGKLNQELILMNKAMFIAVKLIVPEIVSRFAACETARKLQAAKFSNAPLNFIDVCNGNEKALFVKSIFNTINQSIFKQQSKEYFNVDMITFQGFLDLIESNTPPKI